MRSLRKSALLLATFLAAALVPGSLPGATTINAANHFAWGANAGWIEARGDVSQGAVIGEYVCSGFIYAANVGWINLGNGAPTNGISYNNTSAADFGVNHDGRGNLRGSAWGANIGWVSFESLGAPGIDLASGRFTGCAYSANCGWISLSNAQAVVQTDTIAAGTDTDEDTIPDAWELTHFGDIKTADAKSNADTDLLSDLEEYLADTDPRDPLDVFRITSLARGGDTPDWTRIDWLGRDTRSYALEQRPALGPDAWKEIWVSPAAGISNAEFKEPSEQNFYRVRAFRPLSK